MKDVSLQARSLVAAALALAVLSGCSTPASPSAPVATAPGSASPSASSSVARVDLDSYPTFCAVIQSLVSVGDEFGGILTQFNQPRDLDLIHQSGGDLARLYASETSLYSSLASGPDPRIASDAAEILVALPAADGAVADLAVGASEWDGFNRDLTALYASPVFSDTSSAAHVASDGLWDLAYATCDNLDG